MKTLNKITLKEKYEKSLPPAHNLPKVICDLNGWINNRKKSFLSSTLLCRSVNLIQEYISLRKKYLELMVETSYLITERDDLFSFLKEEKSE